MSMLFRKLIPTFLLCNHKQLFEFSSTEKTYPVCIQILCKADISNLLSLLAQERSRFATCQWELLTPTGISIPLTHRLVLYAFEAGGNSYSAFKNLSGSVTYRTFIFTGRILTYQPRIPVSGNAATMSYIQRKTAYEYRFPPQWILP